MDKKAFALAMTRGMGRLLDLEPGPEKQQAIIDFINELCRVYPDMESETYEALDAQKYHAYAEIEAMGRKQANG